MAMHSRKALGLGFFCVALLDVQTAIAAPVTYNYTGVVTSSTGLSGTSVGNSITGSFSYDASDSNLFTTGILFTASTGTFSESDDFFFQLNNNGFGTDSQFIQGLNNQVQFGMFFGQPDGSAISGTTLAHLNFDLGAWQFEQVRWNVFTQGVLTRGWTGNITSITPAQVPEPSTVALMCMALTCLVGSRSMQRGQRARKAG
jgi:hypothetical protein